VRLDTRSRQEIIKADGEDYRKAGKKGRGEILNRPVLAAGLNRGRLAARLRNCGKDGAVESGGEAGKGKRKARPGGKRGGRSQVCGERLARVLEAIWREHGR
jgi:hypothetical protein